ncbi:MAG: T9SS type A sorting domain-containing protein [Elusimicrobiales bacterium]|nr:T9SS type A sorting domain-containing protein [Elusimicrobiales bacterium]
MIGILQARYALQKFIWIFVCVSAAARLDAFVSSSGGYQVESSVIDNGGGAPLSGGGYLARGSAGQRLPGEGSGLAVSGGYVNRTGFYNPPHFAFQKGLASVAISNSGAVRLALPPGAVNKEVFDITINRNPMAAPLSVDPGVINSANSKIEQNEGGWSRLLPGNIIEMTVFDEQDVWARPFAQSGALAVSYRDDNGDGVLDGSNPPVRIETVNPWALDEALSLWTKLPAALSDRASKVITAPLTRPGVYALLGTVDESVKDVYAFPVPFRPGGPNAGSGAGQTGTEAGGITFTNIPQVGNIEIYTLDGRLVRRLAIPGGLFSPMLKWDVRTAGGGRAASGVYIWRVVSGSNSKTGKLMVIW